MRRLILALALSLALPASAQEIVVTFGGDVNFAQSRAQPRADRVYKYGTYSLGHTTDFLSQEFTGHINFVNAETVVSARDGARLGKTFVFRSHPDQFRHLMDLGVNAFSLANNHAYDHGWQGMADTLAFFQSEEAGRAPMLYAGIGRGADATAPSIRQIGGVRVAMSAIGIGASAYGPEGDRPGMALWGNPAHWDAVIKGLAEAEADLKILSFHYGTENQMTLNAGQRARIRAGVEAAGIHLVLGHHPHIVRAVEVEPEANRAIFYSLGNLLFVGGAVRDGLPVGQDYGLFGKAFFTVTPDGPQLTALEALPLLNVHLSPRPMSPGRAEQTLAHLSGLSRRAAGDLGAEFSPLGAGATRGAACYGGPYGPAAMALCCRLAHSLACDLPDLM